MGNKFIFTNASVCNADKISKATLHIDGGKFTPSIPSKNAQTIDLQGRDVYPGLINSHDHLLGTWWPRVGNGPYLNWKPWDEDLKACDLYKERGKIPSADIYQLAVYRSILSGVTTVSDHIPHKINKAFIHHSLIRIIKDYTLAHESSSYDLKWGDGIIKEAETARKKNIPFVTHLEEGWDEEAMNGVPYLISQKALFANTVLIHCIACDKKDIQAVGKHKANMVWCPSSNDYMFGVTADARGFIKAGTNVCLGTDSPMSGGVNLLWEMKYARKMWKKMYGSQLSAKELFKMVTVNPERAFSLKNQAGRIANGYSADLLVLTGKPAKEPYEKIASANPEDLDLVMRSGRVLLASEEMAAKLGRFTDEMQKVRLGKKRIVYLAGRPLDLKKRIASAIGFEKKLEFFQIQAA